MVMESGIKFNLIQSFMVVLSTCMNFEDSSKYEIIRVLTTFLPFYVYRDFSRCSGAANSTVPCRILLNFEPFRDFMVVLVTFKIEGDSI